VSVERVASNYHKRSMKPSESRSSLRWQPCRGKSPEFERITGSSHSGVERLWMERQKSFHGSHLLLPALPEGAEPTS
jgi:hypothetical protein